MKGYIDTTAGEIQAGDTLIDPTSGVLCRVESVEPVNDKGIVTLHMRGSVSLGYMGITGKPDRPLRRAPRPGATTQVAGVDEVMGERVSPLLPARRYDITITRSGLCSCGKRLERECADECVR